jgi:hypothetical protein
MKKTRFLWYWLKSEENRWGVKQPVARWQWQHYKTSRGWFQMMRFGFFGVNIYREISYFVPGSKFELRGVSKEAVTKIDIPSPPSTTTKNFTK